MAHRIQAYVKITERRGTRTIEVGLGEVREIDADVAVLPAERTVLAEQLEREVEAYLSRGGPGLGRTCPKSEASRSRQPDVDLGRGLPPEQAKAYVDKLFAAIAEKKALDPEKPRLSPAQQEKRRAALRVQAARLEAEGATGHKKQEI